MEQRYLGDKAYVGDEQILTPTKTSKGGELSAQQKERNRELSNQLREGDRGGTKMALAE